MVIVGCMVLVVVAWWCSDGLSETVQDFVRAVSDGITLLPYAICLMLNKTNVHSTKDIQSFHYTF